MGSGASQLKTETNTPRPNQEPDKSDSDQQCMASERDEDELGDLPSYPPKKKPIRRPSEMVTLASMMEMEEEEELEKKTIQGNPSLKSVFKGFKECKAFLADEKNKSDPSEEHFATLNKLLADKVTSMFNKNKKDEERTVMGNNLAEIGFVGELVKYYNFVIEEIALEGVTEGFVEEAKDRGEPGDNLVLSIREILWNFSDLSTRFAEKIALTDIFKNLVEDLKLILEDGLEQLEALDERFAFDSAVGILHNCARKPNIGKEKFRSIGTVDVLAQFVQADHLYVKTITLLALGNMIKEDEVDTIHAGTDVHEFLMNAVKQALDAEERKEYGFHLSELVDGLAVLAQSEKNKKLIMAKKPLPLLKKIMSSKDSHEVLAAIKLAWELAFLEENKKMMNSDQEFMKILKTKCNDKNKEVKDAATGALFVVEKMTIKTKTAPVPEPTPARAVGGAPVPSGKHIMFSYSWADKEMVYKIYHILKSEGHPIWIDIEEMNKYANLLEGMSQAVEQAHTILVCFSEKYKSSQNCRTEADYAFTLSKNIIPLKLQRGYTPDGWLGIFIGARLFIEFTDKYPFEVKMNELRAMLPSPSQVQPAPSKPKEPLPDVKPSPEANKNPTTDTTSSYKRLTDWQKQDVENWAVKNGMSNFKSVKLLTGNQLKFLLKVSEKAPDTFYRWCEDKLKLKTLEDLMLFNDAVEKLHMYS